MECQAFSKNLILLSRFSESLLTHRADLNNNLSKLEYGTRVNNRCEWASTSGNRIKSVRLTLPMMRGGAGLDAFLQSWDERGDLLKKMGGDAPSF